MSPLLVEMLGLPGSGKSTLARETCLALRARDVPAGVVDEPISAAVPRARRLRRRTSAAVRAAAQWPSWSSRSATQIAALRQATRRDTASALAQWLAVCDLAGRARAEPGIHLLEEGPRQTLWTLGLRSPDPLPTHLLRSWPAAAAPDLVVVLDVPVEVVEARLTRRVSRHSRSQHLPADLLRAELIRGQALVDRLVSATSVPVIRLGGDDGPTATQRGCRLADLLAPLHAGSA